MSSSCGRSEPRWVKMLAPFPLIGRGARRARELAGRRSGRRGGGSGFGFDGGGTAGVREPRRPKPAPPALSVRLDEPVG